MKLSSGNCRSAASYLGGAAFILSASTIMALAQDTGNRLVTLQGIKSATVAPNGLAFGALGLSNRRESEGAFFDSADGSLILGFGLGNASETVGFQFTANITSLTDNFGDSGSFSVKASRQINGLNTATFVGLSLDSLGAWGDGVLGDETATLMLTVFPTASIGGQTYPLMITAGYGTNVVDRRSEPGAYVGAGIGLTKNFGASLAWTGESVTLGTSFRFDALQNFSFAASIDDAFDQVDGQRLTVSATYYFDDIFGG